MHVNAVDDDAGAARDGEGFFHVRQVDTEAGVLVAGVTGNRLAGSDAGVYPHADTDFVPGREGRNGCELGEGTGVVFESLHEKTFEVVAFVSRGDFLGCEKNPVRFNAGKNGSFRFVERRRVEAESFGRDDADKGAARVCLESVPDGESVRVGHVFHLAAACAKKGFIIYIEGSW